MNEDSKPVEFTKPAKAVSPAAPALPAHEHHGHGGSYVCNADGTKTLVERTQDGVYVPPQE